MNWRTGTTIRPPARECWEFEADGYRAIVEEALGELGKPPKWFMEISRLGGRYGGPMIVRAYVPNAQLGQQLAERIIKRIVSTVPDDGTGEKET